MTKLLSLKQVTLLVEISAKTIRLWTTEGKFPQPVYLPNGDKRWHETDVMRWLLALPGTAPPEAVKRK